MNVLVNENSLQDIADAIREKNGTEATYKPSEMGEAIRGIVFVENFAHSIQFRDLDWAGEELVLNLYNAEDLSNLFNSDKNISLKRLTINCNKPILSATRMIYMSPINMAANLLERVTLNADFSKLTNFYQWFHYGVNLKIIDGVPLDFSSATAINSLFYMSRSVTYFRVAEKSIKININLSSCSSLDTATIQSVIDGLADLTGQTSQTLTFHADVKAKLTEEQIATITSKNWTLA